MGNNSHMPKRHKLVPQKASKASNCTSSGDRSAWAIDYTARRIADIRASDEGREGVQSFLGKRAPAWKDHG